MLQQFSYNLLTYTKGRSAGGWLHFESIIKFGSRGGMPGTTCGFCYVSYIEIEQIGEICDLMS